LENWLQLARRRADNAQHIRGGRLLLQRLPQFVQQPRVLDGDDRLGGEGPEKRYLPICKRINFGTSKQECSDRHSLTQQWNTSDHSLS
jgi:hypothetical protein